VTARISNTRIKMTKIGPNNRSDYFTSGVYPYLFEDDGISTELTPITTPKFYSIPTERVGITGVEAVSGSLDNIVVTYDNYIPENLRVNNIAITSANLEVTVNYVVYDNYPTENLRVANISIRQGTLEEVVNFVTYNNYPEENFAVNNISIQSGTFT